MAQNNNEEIDLGLVFRKIGDLYRGFLIWLYRGFHFVLRNWIIFLLIVAAGAIVGYFLEKNTKVLKESTIVVQINFDASNYAYDAIDQINGKIRDYDTLALKKMGFYNEKGVLILGVSIEPIVNIIDILKEAPRNEKNMEVLMDESQFSDDLLTTEMFRSEYSTHKILLTTPVYADDGVISDLVKYLNSNEIFNSIKLATIKNTKLKIAQNIQSISYMDSIFKIFGTKAAVNLKEDQIHFNSFGALNSRIDLMFREKRAMLNDLEYQEVQLLKYNNIVQTLNKPFIRVKKSSFDNKRVIVPIIFVFAFLFLIGLKSIYLRAKELSEQQE